jgi:Spy/CpxP family protein refolding chaperone
MKPGLPIAAALLLAVPPVLAAEPAPAPVAKPAKVKKVCRKHVPTGRRLAERTCLTQEQWAEIDAANAAAARNFADETTRHAGIAGPARNPVTGQ